MKKQNSIPPGKLAMIVAVVAISLLAAVWSAFRSIKANDRTVQPPTVADLEVSIQNADRQIQEIMNNRNMPEDARQRALGYARSGRGRLEAQYNKLKSGQKLTGPG